jgi:anaphase-promoting complex subunit 4
MNILSETALSLIEAKIFANEIRPELVRCCPTMDLIAYVTIDERVEVYRFGGQRAFVCNRKESDINVLSICWKYNGIVSTFKNA